MAIDKILSRLPSHFNKSVDSNNYKALSLVADMIDDSEKLYDMILKFWDVDQAEGYGLDRLGKDEGISRGSYDDETYRKMIKIQFIVNMSDGNIEVINTILSAYMGDDFLYVEEGWSGFLEEPAAMSFYISEFTKHIPQGIIRRIKPAGVRVYLVAIGNPSNLMLMVKPYEFSVPYRICNMFRTDDIEGRLMAANIHLNDKGYDFTVEYPICNMFVTATIGNDERDVPSDIILTKTYQDNDIIYKRAGGVYTGEGEI